VVGTGIPRLTLLDVEGCNKLRPETLIQINSNVIPIGQG